MEDIVAGEESLPAASQSRGYHLICLLTPHLKRGIFPQPQITQEEKDAGCSSDRSPN
jgi:hypothetical protein